MLEFTRLIEASLCLSALALAVSAILASRRKSDERMERNTQLILGAISALRSDLSLANALRSVPPPPSSRSLPRAPMVDEEEDDSEKTLVKGHGNGAARH